MTQTLRGHVVFAVVLWFSTNYAPIFNARWKRSIATSLTTHNVIGLVSKCFLGLVQLLCLPHAAPPSPGLVLDGNRTLASIFLLLLHTSWGQILALSLTSSLLNLLPLAPAHVSEPVLFTDLENLKAHVMSPELGFFFLGISVHVYYP